MADYNTNNLSKANVSSLQTINTTLNSIEKKTISKPVYKNVVSKQKDITIDLTQFLDIVEQNKYINIQDDNSK